MVTVSFLYPAKFTRQRDGRLLVTFRDFEEALTEGADDVVAGDDPAHRRPVSDQDRRSGMGQQTLHLFAGGVLVHDRERGAHDALHGSVQHRAILQDAAHELGFGDGAHALVLQDHRKL